MLVLASNIHRRFSSPHTELVAVGIEEGPQQRAHWWYRVLVVLMEDLQNSYPAPQHRKMVGGQQAQL